MKYAHYNKDTQALIGFYSDDIHSSIPTPNVQISEDVWSEALSKGFNKVNKDGTLELFDFRTEDEKAQQELNNKIQEAKDYLASTDYKMLPNYVVKENEDINAIIAKRNEAREFIRSQG